MPEWSELEEDLRAHRRTVDTEYFDLSLREIVRMVEEEEIRIAPEYQRQFRWKEETRSALIESFLLGLPVPSIFVATNQDATHCPKVSGVMLPFVRFSGDLTG